MWHKLRRSSKISGSSETSNSTQSEDALGVALRRHSNRSSAQDAVAIAAQDTINIGNEDVIAKYEHDMSRFGLRPSLPGDGAGAPMPNINHEVNIQEHNVKKYIVHPDSAAVAKTAIKSITAKETNQRGSKRIDAKTADHLALKKLARSFYDMHKSLDATLDKYHLKDTLPEKECDKQLSSVCLGIVKSFACGDNPMFPDCTPGNGLVEKNKAAGAAALGPNVYQSMDQSPRYNSDVVHVTTKTSFSKQQQLHRQQQNSDSFNPDSSYQRNAYKVQCSKSTNRNDEVPLHLARKTTDRLLDELRQSSA